MGTLKWARLAAFSGLVLGLWTCEEDKTDPDKATESVACTHVTDAVNDFNAAHSNYPANQSTALAKMDAGIAELTTAIQEVDGIGGAAGFTADLNTAKTVAQGVRASIAANSQTPNWTGLGLATDSLGNDCSQINEAGVTTP